MRSRLALPGALALSAFVACSMGLNAGNAQSGKLETKWNGKRPPGCAPKKLDGSIVWGTGGDGSDYGKGTLVQGVMTRGNPLDSIDDQAQANIVAVGFGKRQNRGKPAEETS